jgi:hypothetical protein
VRDGRVVDLTAPDPLAQFLDAGGDLRSAYGDFDAVIELLADAIDYDDTTCQEYAAHDRWLVEEALAGRGLDRVRIAAAGERGWDSLQQYVTAKAWDAELLAAPALRTRVEALLTEDESRKLAHLINIYQHPNPFVVDTAPPSQRCCACGSAFATGDCCLTIGFRYEFDAITMYSPVPDLHYCNACVSLAAAALTAGDDP